MSPAQSINMAQKEKIILAETLVNFNTTVVKIAPTDKAFRSWKGAPESRRIYTKKKNAGLPNVSSLPGVSFAFNETLGKIPPFGKRRELFIESQRQCVEAEQSS